MILIMLPLLRFYVMLQTYVIVNCQNDVAKLCLYDIIKINTALMDINYVKISHFKCDIIISFYDADILSQKITSLLHHFLTITKSNLQLSQ